MGNLGQENGYENKEEDKTRKVCDYIFEWRI